METELMKLIEDIKKVVNEPRKVQGLIEVFSQMKLEFGEGELYRDKSGFILIAYAEMEGKYRAPHNHGDGWVIYTLVAGEMEMGSFKRSAEGRKVTRVGGEILKAGQSRLYQSGDIHDTKCLSEKSIILRFTSCDLKKEEQEGRMLRFES